MNQQEEIEREQAAVEIQTANLRELARLVLEFKDSSGTQSFFNAYNAMIDFAKGVAQ